MMNILIQLLIGLAFYALVLEAQSPGDGPENGGIDAGGSDSVTSPPYPLKFLKSVPTPVVSEPLISHTVNGKKIEYYELTVQTYEESVYPDLGNAHFVVYTYNGTVNPTFRIERGTETVIRVLNEGPEGASFHLHGSPTLAPWDGWADDVIEPGSFKDYYYPNSQTARSIMYHDHINGATAEHVYDGQGGLYVIYDPAEDDLGLPIGDYDVALSLTDKSYLATGELYSIEDERINFYGDIIHVNNVPWPYLKVEPRKYRLRFYNLSVSRPYELSFVDADGNVITVQIIGSDAGLFGKPVTTDSLIISGGERYEVVIDFASLKGQNVTLANSLFAQYDIPEFEDTDKVMRFVVGQSVSDNSNNAEVPAILNPNIAWPETRDTPDHIFEFNRGGDNIWTINGIDFDNDNSRILASPQQGSTELWQFDYAGGPGTHPIHTHLVEFQVVSRSRSNRGVEPYEAAGLKDVVFMAPGESLQVVATFGPPNGAYMFHCHNLVHEDWLMMDVFNVTLLEALGYKFNSTAQFADPEDPRYKAQPSKASDFEPESIMSTLDALGSLNAYALSSLSAAESKYYATAAYTGEGAASTGEHSAYASETGGHNGGHSAYGGETTTYTGETATYTGGTSTYTGESATHNGGHSAYTTEAAAYSRGPGSYTAYRG